MTMQPKRHTARFSGTKTHSRLASNRARKQFWQNYAQFFEPLDEPDGFFCDKMDPEWMPSWLHEERSV